MVKSRDTLLGQTLNLKNEEKVLMGKLQIELKRLTRLTSIDHELAKFIKPIIIATQTMDFNRINREMALIQKRNTSKMVNNVKHLFKRLEELPQSIADLKNKAINISATYSLQKGFEFI